VLHVQTVLNLGKLSKIWTYFHPKTNLRQQNFKPSQIFWWDICLNRFHPLRHNNLPNLKQFGEHIRNGLFKRNRSLRSKRFCGVGEQ